MCQHFEHFHLEVDQYPASLSGVILICRLSYLNLNTWFELNGEKASIDQTVAGRPIITSKCIESYYCSFYHSHLVNSPYLPVKPQCTRSIAVYLLLVGSVCGFQLQEVKLPLSSWCLLSFLIWPHTDLLRSPEAWVSFMWKDNIITYLITDLIGPLFWFTQTPPVIRRRSRHSQCVL